MNWSIEGSIIFESVFGSQIYGTSTPESDKDYRGVCIPPWEVRNSFLFNFDQKDKWEGKFEDRVIFNLKKFLALCCEANPAIIELLFVPEKFWVTCKAPWIEILDRTNYFLSKKAKYTFTGYAHAQLKRIKTHRNWLLNPPKEEPTRDRFNLPKNPRLSKEQLSAVVSIPEEILDVGYRGEARREKSYCEARKYWDLYMNWAKNRNPKRALLEEKYGYDTKHAMHLIRLMHEGEELLLAGRITFPRPELEELLAVLAGAYSYEQLMEKVEKFDQHFEDLYDKSNLPNSPDVNAVNKLYLKLLEERTK